MSFNGLNVLTRVLAVALLVATSALFAGSAGAVAFRLDHIRSWGVDLIPRSVDTDAQGNVYVLSCDRTGDACLFQKYSPNGDKVGRAVGSQGSGASRLSDASGIAVSRRGTVFISEAKIADTIHPSVKNIKAFNRSGSLTRSFTSLNEPHDLAIGNLGRLYVSTLRSSSGGKAFVEVFTESGRLLRTYATQASAASPIATKQSGGQFVVSLDFTVRPEIYRYRGSDGLLLSPTIKLPGISSIDRGATEPSLLSGLDLDRSRFIFATIENKNRVLMLNGAGSILAEAPVFEPADVAGSVNSIFVADGRNRKIQKFAISRSRS